MDVPFPFFSESLGIEQAALLFAIFYVVVFIVSWVKFAHHSPAWRQCVMGITHAVLCWALVLWALGAYTNDLEPDARGKPHIYSVVRYLFTPKIQEHNTRLLVPLVNSAVYFALDSPLNVFINANGARIPAVLHHMASCWALVVCIQDPTYSGPVAGFLFLMEVRHPCFPNKFSNNRLIVGGKSVHVFELDV